MDPWVVALALLQFTGPTGQRIDVNPLAVSSIREPRGGEHFAQGTKCLILMSNSSLIAVQEDCDVVRVRLDSEIGP